MLSGQRTTLGDPTIIPRSVGGRKTKLRFSRKKSEAWWSQSRLMVDLPERGKPTKYNSCVKHTRFLGYERVKGLF
jgi:hypothetical protein